MNKWFEREIRIFYEKSLIQRLTLQLNKSKVSILRKLGNLINDKVFPLESSPLGMYIYNLRILFTILCIAFMVMITCLSIYFDWWKQEKVIHIIIMLWTVLAISMIFRVALRKNFRKDLLEFEQSELFKVSNLFQKYFYFDVFLLILTTFIGNYFFQFSIDSLVFVFIANVLIFGVYTGGDTTENFPVMNPLRNLLLPFIGISVAVGWYVLQSVFNPSNLEPQWFYLLFSGGAIVGSIWIVLFSGTTISFLRRKDLSISQHRLNLIVSMVASVTESTSDNLEKDTYTNRNIIYDGMTSILQTICSSIGYFEYKVARVWLINNYRENDEISKVHQELTPLTSYSTISGYTVPNRLKDEYVESQEILQITHSDMSTLLVPIQHKGIQSGILELYRLHPLLITHQEKVYLNSLSAIMYIAEDLFKIRQETVALEEVDGILTCSSLADAYQKAISLLHNYLSAEGSMLLLLDRNTGELPLAASRGFDEKILQKNKYHIGIGLTGRCVESGKLILRNNVERDESEFNIELLSNVSDALGHKIITWMAIPIKTENEILGLVKVVNKNTKNGKVFTVYDQELAEKLAFKLGVVLEKFINLDKAHKAEMQAEERAKMANEAKNQAQINEKERQEDLVTLAHQLQGPIHAGLGRISLILAEEKLSSWVRKHIEFASSLLSDSIDLIYGVLVVSGMEAGVFPSLNQDNVNAEEEARSIAKRVGKTRDRPDLKFEFFVSSNFPVLQIDKNIYRSVLYTLLHNATKYADRNSIVRIECGFEWPPNNPSQKYPAIKIKTSGPPILFSEKDDIFGKYYRGKSVKFSAKHGTPGIGLGLWVARKLMRGVGGDLALEFDEKNSNRSIFVIHMNNQKNVK